MRADFPVFVGIAALLHIAVAFAIPMTDSGTTTGGEGGESEVSVTAASQAVAAMVEDWETPPELEEPVAQSQPEPEAEDPPELDTRAEAPPPMAQPSRPTPDTAEATPKLETAPVLQ
ncbi:energy transducer TonB, partial [Vannielia litorea]|nr:energy transducer TonB [Vannielia litorea]